MNKKHKKNTKATKKTENQTILFTQETEKQEQAIANLENLVSTIYKDLPLAQAFSGLQDEKQIAKMMAALNGALDALPIDTLTQGLFDNPKEDSKFAKDLSTLLHGLKNLSATVNEHISHKK